jgi:cytidylate kinase
MNPIKINISKEEKEQLKEIAKKKGMSLEEYIKYASKNSNVIIKIEE